MTSSADLSLELPPTVRIYNSFDDAYSEIVDLIVAPTLQLCFAILFNAFTFCCRHVTFQMV